jgi:quercetin dioxygenase-like cupin family protein
MPQYVLRLYTDRLEPKAEIRLGRCNRVVYVRDGDAIVRAGAHAAGLAANSAWYGGDAVALTAGTGGATLLRWELVPFQLFAGNPVSSTFPDYIRQASPVPTIEPDPTAPPGPESWNGASRPSLEKQVGTALAAESAAPGGMTGPGVTSSTTLAHAVELEHPDGHLIRCDRVDFPPGGIAYAHVHRGPGIRCLLAGSLRVEVNGKAHDIAPGGAWFEAGPDPVLALASKAGPTAFVRVMILPRELLGKSSIRYLKPEDAEKPKLQTYRIFVDETIELP